MKKRADRKRAVVGTQTSGFKRALKAFGEKLSRIFFRPALLVRLKGEPGVLYPRMNRREIRQVASAICAAAVKNAGCK